MDFQVEILPGAENEIDGIYSYIADNLDNPIAADRLHSRIMRKISSIGENPYLFRFYFEDETLLAKGYRRAIVDNFLILFTLDEESSLVYVRNVIYGRRDLGSII
jgi:plasmid stabilization system protein ParE